MNNSFLINWRIALWAYDFDGNILAPNSWCYVIDIATGEEKRIVAHTLDQNPHLLGWPNPIYRIHDNPEHSFAHFRDFSTRIEHIGADHLIQDINDAIEQWLFSPSFRSFKETFLIRARFFGIITARGHSAENLSRAMSVINEATLNEDEKLLQYQNIQNLWDLFWKKWTPRREEALDFYFQEIGMYYGVSSPHLCKLIDIDHRTRSSDKKTLAMSHLIQYTRKMASKIPELQDKSFAIGFSDDSISNIESMTQFFMSERKKWISYQEEWKEVMIWSNDKIRVYFTGNQDQLCIIPGEGVTIKKEGDLTKIVI